MPSRYYLRQFYPQTYHHIFNRGAYKNKIFLNQKDYQSFLSILQFYLKYPQGKSLTRVTKKSPAQPATPPYQLLAYCLMPNHFHLLLLQLAEQPTITDLLKRVSITYAMYFQEKHQHAGVLFQGKYKSVPVKSGNQLLYLSKYIHLNPAKIVGTEPTKYLYSSLPAYINEPLASKWLYPEIILENFFPNSPNKAKKYLEFIMDRTDQDLEIITPVAIEL